MSEEEYLIQCLGEEALEIAHRVSKIQRFGINERQPGEADNRARLVQEINDFFGALDLALARGVSFPGLRNPEAITNKKFKILNFLEYSRQLGIVKP